jgi:hypothetical protein
MAVTQFPQLVRISTLSGNPWDACEGHGCPQQSLLDTHFHGTSDTRGFHLLILSFVVSTLAQLPSAQRRAVPHEEENDRGKVGEFEHSGKRDVTYNRLRH